MIEQTMNATIIIQGIQIDAEFAFKAGINWPFQHSGVPAMVSRYGHPAIFGSGQRSG